MDGDWHFAVLDKVMIDMLYLWDKVHIRYKQVLWPGPPLELLRAADTGN